MSIRNYLTLLFSLLCGALLLAFAALVYYSAKQNREQEFYSLLEREALTKAKLLFEGSLAPELLQEIYKRNREVLNEVEVAVFRSNFELLYHDDVELDFVKETEAMLTELAEVGRLRFYQADWQVIGLLYDFEGKRYLLTAAALDQYGYNKLANLRQTILLSLVLVIGLIFIAGRLFSYRAFKPVRELIAQVRQIGATNLHLRVAENRQGDELAELAQTFNAMLDRLEQSFEAQKQFVLHISHELRSPLAAMIVELELAEHKTQDARSYKLVLQAALSDARKLVRLSNSLLDLAKASYDPSEIAFKPIRADEVLLDARQELQQAYPDYKIELHFRADWDEAPELLVSGNAYLLQRAFGNLMENACKFSQDKTCRVWLDLSPGALRLSFEDKGLGIAQDEQTRIFQPFYRGHNQGFAEGHGIGLSLSQRIVELHKGRLNLESKLGEGSNFQVELPLWQPA